MTVEEQLKKMIQSRYKSVREFTIMADIPYTTLDSLFKRGVGASSVNTVIKICKVLGISADALADGEIISVKNYRQTPRHESIEIKEVLEDTKRILEDHDFFTLDGKQITHDTVDDIIQGIDVSVELVKRRN